MSHLQHVTGRNYTLQIGESMLHWPMAWSHTGRLHSIHGFGEHCIRTDQILGHRSRAYRYPPLRQPPRPLPSSPCLVCLSPTTPQKAASCPLRDDVSEQGSLEESLEAAGGVNSNIVEAFRAVLQDSSLDGAFVSAAITLPASTELRDDIPNLNPLLLYQVRCSPGLHVASAVLVAGLLPRLFEQADMMLWMLPHVS